MKKRYTKIIGSLLVIAAVALAAASQYMLSYSLSYPQDTRETAQKRIDRIKEQCPWTRTWMDSVYRHQAVRDTFVTMPSGYRGHALYLYAPHPTGKTAVLVHGYKTRSESMLHIAYLYNHDLQMNVLLPDLYGHGQSEGDHIQMGWKDRKDALRWAEIADSLFSRSGHPVQMVMHGISMGAATTMSASGEETPGYLKCFVEDCGYSSVWEEFSAQLKAQFGLPAFPLMYTTSLLCCLEYGWSFGEASPLEQVKICQKPMLFIHGDKDDFVPSPMVYPLYRAKSGQKQLYIAPGSIHAKAYADHPKEYARAVSRFVGRYLR